MSTQFITRRFNMLNDLCGQRLVKTKVCPQNSCIELYFDTPKHHSIWIYTLPNADPLHYGVFENTITQDCVCGGTVRTFGNCMTPERRDKAEAHMFQSS